MKGGAVPQAPDEDDTPFSLPRDVPEIMPIDHPDLDTNVDSHEAYDEGRDDTVDYDPYRADDDPIKSTKRSMKLGLAGKEKYTVDHDKIQRWVELRRGSPAYVVSAGNGLNRGGLYIYFEDEEPDIEIKIISWKKFFKAFEGNKLAFIFRERKTSGEESRFYRFWRRDKVSRFSEAKKV